MVFENEVGNCSKEELEKFFVLAWPTLVPLKHTYTYMQLVKCTLIIIQDATRFYEDYKAHIYLEDNLHTYRDRKSVV